MIKKKSILIFNFIFYSMLFQSICIAHLKDNKLEQKKNANKNAKIENKIDKKKSTSKITDHKNKLSKNKNVEQNKIKKEKKLNHFESSLMQLADNLDITNEYCIKINDDNLKAKNMNFVEKIFYTDKTAFNNIKKYKKTRIIIDAGHGGRDTGTNVGKMGKTEKDITLHYAQELKNKLQKIGFDVKLTREKDEYLNLRKRVKIARDWDTDLFISLHVNSEHTKKASGIEIYTINKDGQYDNFFDKSYVETYIPSKIMRYFKDNTTFNTVVDMLKKSTQSKSVLVAEYIKKQFKQDEISKCKVKNESLAVLRAFDIPAILIELGYLSNINDEKKLHSESFVNKVTNAITMGIVNVYS